jgi:hypothetical protein
MSEKQANPSLYTLLGSPDVPPESSKKSTVVAAAPEILPTTAAEKPPATISMYKLIGQPTVPKRIPSQKSNSTETDPPKANGSSTFYAVVAKPMSPSLGILNNHTKYDLLL